jgi:isoamylase
MTASADWEEAEGTPLPLGVSASPDAAQYNFALYSKHATSVSLLLYAKGEWTKPCHVEALDWHRHKSGRIWHCRLPAALVEGAHSYAYSVGGPDDPSQGHRFDPDKILLDPYARAVFFPPGFSRGAATHPGANPGRAPLGLLPNKPAPFDWEDDRPPVRHGHDAVIYELHVRGFTKRSNSGVAPERAGTFAGLVDKIPYLKQLGVTVVELMPVFQIDPQEGNYWGYMPLSFFALNGAYSLFDAGEEISEFKTLVKELHRAGIEVVLDVVYNHTAEGSEIGPTYSFRGIDNSTYYLLEPDRRHYRNDSGTGNVLHTANRYVQGLILDSLRYWVTETHVDGFRFDLASLFTRSEDGSINLEDPPIIAAIHSDPVLSSCRLIAEAWDIASYQLGRTFPGITWLQWNGRFRDDLRCFLRGDADMVDRLMTRLYGSDDLFPDTLAEAYHPFQSVNFVTCHDGFTLNDLLSYDHKHNEANGHDNSDGTDANNSWNHGFEGEDGAPAEVLALRQRQAKNAIALLMLSNGTPMLLAGDEFLNTQGGNNNPYNQDNETTWLDWARQKANAGMVRFVTAMIAFRKAHPSIARSRFWRDDVAWFGASGDGVDPHALQVVYTLRGENTGDSDLCVMVNGGAEACHFTIPGHAAGPWRRAVDTARPEPDDINSPGSEPPVEGAELELAARSVVVLIGS